MNGDEGDDFDDMVSLQIWADQSHVVTLRHRKLRSPHDVLEQIDADGTKLDVGDLVTRLVDQTVASIGDVVMNMNDQIDRLEARADDASTDDVLDEISQIRRKCLALKRQMSPQHEALIQIVREGPEWFSADNRATIRETISQLQHFLDDIDVSKERAIVIQDDHNNRAAAQTNKTSYLLSIVAAIFLPLGFLTGVLGMNVAGTPGTQTPDAFWITCTVMAVLVAVQLFAFRRLRWL